MKLSEIIKGRDTSADIEDAIEQAKEKAEGLENAITKAEERRSALLLDGSNAEIRAAERDLDESRLELDRTRAIIAELGKRRDEALEAEDKARKDKLAKQTREASERGLIAIADYEKFAPLVAKALAELAEADRFIRDAYQELPKEDRPPFPLKAYQERTGAPYVPALTGLVQLPHPANKESYWPKR